MARPGILALVRRALSFPFRLLWRLLTVSMTVLIVGFGGGFGGLDPTKRKKIDQPEKANQIVCVDEIKRS